MAWECPGQSVHGRRHELSHFEWGMILGVRRMKHSVSKVVQPFNIPRSMVSCLYQEYLMEGITTHREQCSGRPRVLNDCDQWHLARIVCGNRQATLAEITSTCDAGSTRHISSRSVQHSLASMGYGNRVSLLTQNWIQSLTWSCDIANWIQVDLQHVAWSISHGTSCFRWMMGFVGQTPTVNKATCRLVVVPYWCGVCSCGMGWVRYVALLGDHLQPFIDFMYPHKDGIFHQDTAPCHWNQVVQNWSEGHSREF
jgi:hypothetical protein